MAEGTTLHNLLSKQMASGKIGPREKGAREAVNSMVKMDIKLSGNAKDPISKDISNNMSSESVKQYSDGIKRERIQDNIMKLKK